jgi:N-acetylglucosaminyl-diphospho-decaprenol L-rhamnosyltransferase
VEAVTVTTNDAQHIRGFVACEELLATFDRIVVVDNACTDESPDLARAAGCEVVRCERSGYGAAINRGVRELKGDFFAVLNPDIRFFDRTTVPRLAHHFMHPQVGLVAPALELLDGSLQDSARRTPTPANLLFRRWLSPERGWVRRGGDVEWTVGAFWLARRDAWEKIGGFDERYFLYFDDVDLCHRMRAAGYSVRFDPTVRAQHAFQAASRRPLTAWATRHHIRSALRFFTEHPRYLVDPRPATVGPSERRAVARLPERRAAPRFGSADAAQEVAVLDHARFEVGAAEVRLDGLDDLEAAS